MSSKLILPSKEVNRKVNELVELLTDIEDHAQNSGDHQVEGVVVNAICQDWLYAV